MVSVSEKNPMFIYMFILIGVIVVVGILFVVLNSTRSIIENPEDPLPENISEQEDVDELEIIDEPELPVYTEELAEQDRVYFDEALITQNSSRCEDIIDETLRATCQQVFVQQDAPSQDQQMLEEALKQNDIELCDAIEDAETQQFCILSLQPAEKNEDADLLNEIIIANDKSRCSELSNPENIEFCELILA